VQSVTLFTLHSTIIQFGQGNFIHFVLSSYTTESYKYPDFDTKKSLTKVQNKFNNMMTAYLNSSNNSNRWPTL